MSRTDVHYFGADEMKRPKIDKKAHVAYDDTDIDTEYVPITELQKMRAPQFDGHGEMTVEDAFTKIHQQGKNTVPGYKERGYDWAALRHDVAKHGISKPLGIGYHYPWDDNEEGDDSENGPQYEELRNGNHRAMVALEQGHLFVPVKRMYKGDGDFPEDDRLSEDMATDYRYGAREGATQFLGKPWPRTDFTDRRTRPRKRAKPVDPNQGTLF